MRQTKTRSYKARTVNHKHLRFVFLACALWCTSILPVYAADFTVTPAVIDGKGKVREILKYAVTIENTTHHLLSIYPWVSDLDPQTGKSAPADLGGGSPADERATNLSRWIEVTRGVIDLLPGEKKEVPVLVQIHPSAPTGHYHALIRFSPGGNRADAEANLLDTAEVAINIEVLDDARERLGVGLFAPMQKITSSGEAAFRYRVENIGNRGVVPGGKILIYDSNGREVAELPANNEGRRLEPSEKAELAAVWASGGAFGRYKAKLQLEYGDRGIVEDTTFFWVLPWHKLLGMFGALIVACVLVAFFLHSRNMAERSMVYVREENVDAHMEWRSHKQGRDSIRPTPRTSHSSADAKEQDKERPMAFEERLNSWNRQEAQPELVEVDIPAPRRTTLRRTATLNLTKGGVHLPPRTQEIPQTHKIHLAAKPKAMPDPKHVVKLKK